MNDISLRKINEKWCFYNAFEVESYVSNSIIMKMDLLLV